MGKTIVIQPGGFHPFHAGHLALYQSAKQAFPDAEVYVAATNDTSTRPFPFAVKEKLAQLAGVDRGRFVQVKSPFRAEEITSKYNPATDRLIFVRSEKDINSQPKPGGTKRDGSPSYLQPYTADSELAPFNQHAYMAYLPTVEFGPGMTSATQIRTAWPTLTDRRKTALVMSLYPKTQNNAKLAATVVKLLDAAIGGTESVEEGWIKNDHYNDDRTIDPKTGKPYILMGPAGHGEWDPVRSGLGTTMPTYVYPGYKSARAAADKSGKKVVRAGVSKWKVVPKDDPAEEVFSEHGGQIAGTPAVGGMSASYQRRENQPVAEDYLEERRSTST